MDKVKKQADAITLAVIAVLNALSGLMGLPSWATPEGAMLANTAFLSVFALVRFVLTKAAADASLKEGADVS